MLNFLPLRKYFGGLTKFWLAGIEVEKANQNVHCVEASGAFRGQISKFCLSSHYHKQFMYADKG